MNDDRPDGPIDGRDSDDLSETLASVSDWTEITDDDRAEPRDERDAGGRPEEAGGLRNGRRAAPAPDCEECTLECTPSVFSNRSSCPADETTTLSTLGDTLGDTIGDTIETSPYRDPGVETVASDDRDAESAHEDDDEEDDGSKAMTLPSAARTLPTVRTSDYGTEAVVIRKDDVDHDPEEDWPDLCEAIGESGLCAAGDLVAAGGSGSSCSHPALSNGTIVPSAPREFVDATRPPTPSIGGTHSEEDSEADLLKRIALVNAISSGTYSALTMTELPEEADEEGEAGAAASTAPEDADAIAIAASVAEEVRGLSGEGNDDVARRTEDAGSIAAAILRSGREVEAEEVAAAAREGGRREEVGRTTAGVVAVVLAEESVAPSEPTEGGVNRDVGDGKTAPRTTFPALARARTLAAGTALPDKGGGGRHRTLRNAFSFSRMSSSPKSMRKFEPDAAAEEGGRGVEPPSTPEEEAGGFDGRIAEESTSAPEKEEGNEGGDETPGKSQALTRARTFAARSTPPDGSHRAIRNAVSFSRMSSLARRGPELEEVAEESEQGIEPSSPEDEARGLDVPIVEESTSALEEENDEELEEGEDVGDDGTPPKKVQAVARASTFSAIRHTFSDVSGHRTLRNAVSFSRMSSLKSRRKFGPASAEAAAEGSKRGIEPPSSSKEDEARAFDDWIDENSVAASEEDVGYDLVGDDGTPRNVRALTRARTSPALRSAPSAGGRRTLRTALSFSRMSSRNKSRRKFFVKGKKASGRGSDVDWSMSDIEVIDESEHEGEAEGDVDEEESSHPARIAKDGSNDKKACNGSPSRSINTYTTGTVTVEEEEEEEGGEDALNVEVVRKDGVSRIGYHENGCFMLVDPEEEEEGACEEAEARLLENFFDCGALPLGWGEYDDLRVICRDEASGLLDLVHDVNCGPGDYVVCRDEGGDLLDVVRDVQAEAPEFEILSIGDGEERVIVGIPNDAAPLNLGKTRSASVLPESTHEKKRGSIHKKLLWKMKKKRSYKKSKSESEGIQKSELVLMDIAE